MMRLSFTTLGCPAWDWEKVVSSAGKMGYEGVEVRGIKGEMRLSKLPVFAPENIDETARGLKEKGISIPCLDMSTNFHDLDKLEDAYEECRETAIIAQKLGCRYLRTFGDRFLPGEELPEAAARVAAGLDRMGAIAAEYGCTVLLETHGQFAAGVRVRAIMDRVTHPNAAVLWDVHHTVKFGGETPKETWDLIGPRVKHVHLKDSRGPWDSHQLCNVGDGDLPLEEILRTLAEGGYEGWLSYEHEKVWHPEIMEPEDAFPVYISVIGKLFEKVGIR